MSFNIANKKNKDEVEILKDEKEGFEQNLKKP